MKQIARDSVLHTYVEQSCGDHTIIDNVLMTFLVMVPGQNLPVHYDVPLFREIPKDRAPGLLNNFYLLCCLTSNFSLATCRIRTKWAK